MAKIKFQKNYIMGTVKNKHLQLQRLVITLIADTAGDHNKISFTFSPFQEDLMHHLFLSVIIGGV